MFQENDHGIARTDLMRAHLFERRVVVLDGELDDTTAGRVATELMTLDALGDDRIQLLLNSGGGGLSAAFTVMDVIDLLGVPVHVTCVGRAEGPPIGVLAVAGRRAAVPHAALRFAAPSSTFEGRADDVVRAAAELQDQLRRFAERLADATGAAAEWLLEAIHDRRRVEPPEALRLGLIDEIARSNIAAIRSIDGGRGAGGTLGFQPRRPPR
jgi:ATP-dependent Clp protease protease subunit